MADAKSALIALGGSTETGSSGLPNIPAVPASDNAALNNILSSMKQWMEKAAGDGFTGFATRDELVRAGLMDRQPDGSTSTNIKNRAIPPVPTGLAASGAMTTILVTWDNPMDAYGNHGFTEVWAAETNNFTNAVLIGQGAGFVFSHAVGEDATRYYWIRFVSSSGVKGPFNGVNGTLGQTAKNPSYLLDVLTGQLTESQLYADLNARIDLIDGPADIIGTIPNRLAQLQGQINTISNYPDYNGATTYNANDIVKYSGAIYKALQTTTGNLPTNTTYWLKIGDYSSLADAVAAHTAQINTLTTNDTAQSSQITTLFSEVGKKSTIYRQPTAPSAPVLNDIWIDTSTSYSSDYFQDDYGIPRFKQYMWNGSVWVLITDDRIWDTQSALQIEQTTRASADSALSQQITTLSATVNNNQASTSAALIAEQTARADADTALTQQVAALESTVATNYSTLSSSISSEQTARATADTALAMDISTLSATVTNNNTALSAAIQSEQTARASADGALSSSISTLQTTVGDHTTSIQTHAESIDGLFAQYTVKIDNNGYVSGYGLASSAPDGIPTSEFMVVADKFTIAPVATNPAAADGSPFYHLTVPTIIDGVTVPAGTYMKTAFIADASINNAKIGSLAADKITTGTLAAGRIATNSITADKINGTNLQVVNGTFSGSLQAATGTFTGALSAATGTFSGRLTAGTLDPSVFAGRVFTYNTPGVYTITVPTDTGWSSISIRFTLQGAGGGGGGVQSMRRPAGAGGGGAGSEITITVNNLTPGKTYTLVVGAGGGGGYGYANGAAGGATTLLGYSASGGAGGGGALGGEDTVGIGAGGSIGGQSGYAYWELMGYSQAYGGAGGSSVYGSGGARTYPPQGWGATGLGGGIGAGGSGASSLFNDNYNFSGGSGGGGHALIEFFDPNAVVTNTRYQNLIAWLDTNGHGAVPANAR